MPPNTVYGRMGISTGPGQAIPFSIFLQGLGAAPGTWTALQTFTGGIAANAVAISANDCPVQTPGARGPLFVCGDPSGTSAAGTNGVAQFWMGNSLTGTPGANDSVAVTMAAANGNNRGFVGTLNLVANQCGPSSNAACSGPNGFLDGLLTGLEIDVNTDASFSIANRAFNRTLGTYAKNGLEIYSLGAPGTGNGPNTAAVSIWCSDSTIVTCWHEGIVVSRASDIGLHFVANPNVADTGTVFGVAAIYDESNSGISILETGTHTSIIDVSGATYTNVINCGSLACKIAGVSLDMNGGPFTFNGITTLSRNGVNGNVTINSNAGSIIFTPATVTMLNLTSSLATFAVPVIIPAVLIASLPSCVGGLAGARSAVTNGVATPTFGSTVSTTGAVWSPVVCNGTNWIYG